MEYEEILIALQPLRKWNDFANSLVQQYGMKGDLTENQWNAAERMILKTRATAERKASMTRDVDVSRIKELLESAKVKKPVFRANELSFSLAPVSGKNAGAVYVKARIRLSGQNCGWDFYPIKWLRKRHGRQYCYCVG